MRSKDVEDLYAEHSRSLLGFLVYRVGDRADAEDLLADTFERALLSRRRFNPRRGSARTWLYSIAMNLVRDRARRRAAEARAVDRVGAQLDEAPSGDLEAAEARTTVLAALGNLSEEEREAVALRYGADLTLEMIAGVIGEPRTTVEARVYRALRKLREDLD